MVNVQASSAKQVWYPGVRDFAWVEECVWKLLLPSLLSATVKGRCLLFQGKLEYFKLIKYLKCKYFKKTGYNWSFQQRLSEPHPQQSRKKRNGNSAFLTKQGCVKPPGQKYSSEILGEHKRSKLQPQPCVSELLIDAQYCLHLQHHTTRIRGNHVFKERECFTLPEASSRLRLKIMI